MPDNTSLMLAYALHEALDSVVAPDVRDEVIAVALNFAGLSELPKSTSAFLSFVRGPLVQTLEQIVGERTARLGLEEFHRLTLGSDQESTSEIRPIAEVAAAIKDSERSSGPVTRNTSSEPASSADEEADEGTHTNVVLMASMDDPCILQLSDLLSDKARVEAVDDVLALIEAVKNDPRHYLVIIDGSMPTVSVATLVALGPDMPDHARVLLWKLDKMDREQIAESYEQNPNWIDMASAKSVEQLADTCKELLD
ncbi:MAG: hypothetical protein IPJ88_14125 [Myxococcales bacterium]|nr:MAG: hypothetical protein IPJ88_14125 [Myxococcales bacterium]